MIFISKVFPLDERSGLNLKGEINTESIIQIPNNIDLNDFEKFHFNFWNLHNIIYAPIEAVSSWDSVKESIAEVLNYFESNPTFYKEDIKQSKYINSITIFYRWYECNDISSEISKSCKFNC